MRILKWGGLGLLGLIAVLLALNWSTIKRLMTVNTLFDADRIVENFSNMDDAFLHHDLEIGEIKPWDEDIQALPETVMVGDTNVALMDVLEELDTTALVVIRDGKLIHESYYKDTERDDLRISWSVAKSFMSGLYGQAIEDGLMDISQPIESYLPQLKGTAYEGATVANILNMASGVRFNEDYMDPKSDINDMGRVLGLGGSMDKYTETLVDRQYEPGATWQYVSIDTHVAAMALRKVTGKSLHQMWEETYGANLGMGKSPFYLTDGEDVAFALGGLNLRTRDYAKFGQLFLQGGEWGGQQLVPADWVKASTVNHAPNIHPVRGSGYGYQWWVPMPQEGPSKGDFFAVGIYGQYIYTNPEAGIVIAKNAADREFTQPQSNGQHSMNMNIDMFRSLAEQLKDISYDEDDEIELFEQAVAFGGQDLRQGTPSKTYRLFKSGESHHHFALVQTARGYDLSSKALLLARPEPDFAYNRSFENELTKAEARKLIGLFEGLDICSDGDTGEVVLDGVAWLFETSDKNTHCSRYYLGEDKLPYFRALLTEIERESYPKKKPASE